METLLKLIIENARRTGNRSGISVVKLKQLTGFTFQKTIQLLQQLYDDQRAEIREGINSKLVFAI